MLEGPWKPLLEVVTCTLLLQGARVVLHVGHVGLEDTRRAQGCLLIFPLASVFPESTDLFIHKAEMMSGRSYSGVNP